MKKTISRKGAKLAKNTENLAAKLPAKIGYGVYTPTKAEAAAVKRGRGALKRGDYLALGKLHHQLDVTRQQARKKRSRKAS